VSAPLAVTLEGDTLAVEVVALDPPGRYRVRVGETWHEVDGPPAGLPGALLVDGAAFRVDDVAEEDGEIVVTLGADSFRLRVEASGGPAGRRRGGRGGTAGQRLTAPMPGRVVAVHVAVGDRVAADAPLVVLEAMKMENEFRATAGGTVTEVAVTAGQAVNAGDLLVALGPDAG
jgi:biotin carboxyl carrier protein